MSPEPNPHSPPVKLVALGTNSVEDDFTALAKLLEKPRDAGRLINSEGADCASPVERNRWKAVADRVSEDSNWFAGTCLFILSALYVVLWAWEKRNPLAILEFVMLPMILLLYRHCAKWRILSLWGNQGDLGAWLETNRNRFWVRQWKFLCFVRLKALEQTWLWVLFIGLATEYANDLAHPKTNVNEMALKSLSVFLLALITFIATTVIDELYHTRGRFQATLKALTSSGAISEQLHTKLTTFNSVLEGFMSQAWMKAAADLWRDMIENLAESGVGNRSVQTLSKELAENLERQARRTSEQITIVKTSEVKNADKLLLWLLTTLNRHYAYQTAPQNHTPLVLLTGFSTLAEIAGELLERSCLAEDAPFKGSDRIEFFTLLVLPPKKFLNFDQMEFCTDKRWKRFLADNVKARENNIPVYRHFLAIKGVQKYHDKEWGTYLKEKIAHEPLTRSPQDFLPQEAVVLDAEEMVAPQLKELVDMDSTTNLPRVSQDDSGRDRYLMGKNINGGKPLGEVIASSYHCGQCCRILEVAPEDFRRELMDDVSHKPLDYFAIRWEGQWLFCLQSRYDKDFDVAKIEVLHAGLALSDQSSVKENWEAIVKKLDSMFIKNPGIGKRTPIETYMG